jgi:uncharacterized membrane protein YebE (DUF533 family)
MMNFDSILKKIMESPLASGAAGGLLSGGLIGALGNKHARKALGGAAKLGGAAAVGALALAALQRYQAQQAGAQPIAGSPAPVALTPPALEREAAIVVQAMLSAAHADGAMDATERARIGERLRAAGLDDAEFDYVMTGLNAAADPHRIAALAQSEAEAAEIYAASLLVLDVDHWAEQAYLRELKSALKLPEALAVMLEAEVKAPTPL